MPFSQCVSLVGTDMYNMNSLPLACARHTDDVDHVRMEVERWGPLVLHMCLAIGSIVRYISLMCGGQRCRKACPR